MPIVAGALVTPVDATGNEIWTVSEIKGQAAVCIRETGNGEESQAFAKKELVVVKGFGDAIYPTLKPVDRVNRGGEDKPWHVLVEADNYHALQLLLYTHEGEVDCIYIDPPYNTGARDWKYNNDYVDRNDRWRHSKWLSFMKKRLLLARRLLAPTGVLIVTIDDWELFNLGQLLLQVFPDYSRYIVTIEHNKRGRRGKNFAKTNEWAIFLVPAGLEVIQEEEQEEEIGGETRNLRRTGSGSRRHERPKKFFPIYVNEDTLKSLAKQLSANGLRPGDPDWEKHGVCQAVAWPRIKYIATGFPQRRDSPVMGDTRNCSSEIT